MKKIEDLRQYQLDLSNYILETKKALLCVDMGLGKTVSTLTAINSILAEVKRILIVAPKNVAINTWTNEMLKFEHLNNLYEKTTNLTGLSKDKRKKALSNNSKIFIINRENIVNLYENVGKDFFDVIVWDESSSLKSAKMSNTTSGNITRFKALTLMTENCKRVILLTGTPTPNGIENIYGQIKALDPKNCPLGYYKKNFYDEYFRDVSKKNYPIYVIKDGSFEKIVNKISKYVVKMKSEDYLQLPDCEYINITFDLDSKTKKVYKDIINRKSIDNVNNNSNIITINKALQVSSGFLYDNDKNAIELNNLKIEILKEIIEENENKNIIIVYNYLYEKDLLLKTFTDLKIFNSSLENDWNNKKIKLMGLNPKSGGHGINLQFGGNIMIHMSLLYDLEMYQQVNKRLHRSGQTEDNVKIYHILANDTIDMHVLDVLQQKTSEQDLFLELSKNI